MLMVHVIRQSIVLSSGIRVILLRVLRLTLLVKLMVILFWKTLLFLKFTGVMRSVSVFVFVMMN